MKNSLENKEIKTNDLLDKVSSYDKEEGLELIKKAFDFARIAIKVKKEKVAKTISFILTL